MDSLVNGTTYSVNALLLQLNYYFCFLFLVIKPKLLQQPLLVSVSPLTVQKIF
jgi:hypothetical protein